MQLKEKRDYKYFHGEKPRYFGETVEEIYEGTGNQFYDVLQWRIRSMRSNIIIVVGEQGSGKSNTGLAICERLNKIFYKKKFDINKHLFHSILRFTKNMKKLRGSFVLLEECGVELNSKDWREAQNRVFRDIIETFRIYNINLVLTLPNLNDLDKSSRYLSHFIIRMNYPSNAIIFRKFSSFLTEKQYFLPVWEWKDIPNVRKYNKDLWNAYNQWHEKYMNDKRFDWLEEIELRNLKKKYKKKWYKDRTTEFEILPSKPSDLDSVPIVDVR